MEGWCGMAGWYEVHRCVEEGGRGEGGGGGKGRGGERRGEDSRGLNMTCSCFCHLRADRGKTVFRVMAGIKAMLCYEDAELGK